MGKRQNRASSPVFHELFLSLADFRFLIDIALKAGVSYGIREKKMNLARVPLKHRFDAAIKAVRQEFGTEELIDTLRPVGLHLIVERNLCTAYDEQMTDGNRGTFDFRCQNSGVKLTITEKGAYRVAHYSSIDGSYSEAPEYAGSAEDALSKLSTWLTLNMDDEARHRVEEIIETHRAKAYSSSAVVRAIRKFVSPGVQLHN